MKYLSGRLAEIYDIIPDNCDNIADIGCDHGKLVVACVFLGKTKHAYGIDISEKSLIKARDLAEKYGVSDKITFVVGDGFRDINTNFDVAVIAGMGGNETIKILSQKHEAKYYIFCPHQDAAILRKYMKNNNLSAIFDFVVEENNKFYPVIMAQRGKTDYTDDEIILGKNFPPRQEYADRNTFRKKHIEELIKKAGSMDKLSEEIIKEYEVLLRNVD